MMSDLHRIYFELNPYVGIGILNDIADKLEQLPVLSWTADQKQIGFTLSLTKGEAAYFDEEFSRFTDVMMDFDQGDGGSFI